MDPTTKEGRAALRGCHIAMQREHDIAKEEGRTPSSAPQVRWLTAAAGHMLATLSYIDELEATNIRLNAGIDAANATADRLTSETMRLQRRRKNLEAERDALRADRDALRLHRDNLSEALSAAMDQQADYREQCMRDRAELERAREVMRNAADACGDGGARYAREELVAELERIANARRTP